MAREMNYQVHARMCGRSNAAARTVESLPAECPINVMLLYLALRAFYSAPIIAIIHLDTECL